MYSLKPVDFKGTWIHVDGDTMTHLGLIHPVIYEDLLSADLAAVRDHLAWWVMTLCSNPTNTGAMICTVVSLLYACTVVVFLCRQYYGVCMRFKHFLVGFI